MSRTDGKAGGLGAKLLEVVWPKKADILAWQELAKTARNTLVKIRENAEGIGCNFDLNGRHLVTQKISEYRDVDPIHATAPIVAELLEQYEQLSDAYRTRSEQSKDQYDQERNSRLEQVKAKNDEIGNLRSEHSAEVDHLKAKHWDEISEMRQRHREETNRDNKRHEEEVRDMRQQHDQLLDRTRSTNESARRKLLETIQEAQNKIITTQKQLEEAQKSHETAMAATLKRLEDEIRRAAEDKRKMEDGHKMQLLNEKQMYDADLETRSERYEKKLFKTKKAHHTEVTRLVSMQKQSAGELESYSGALLTRDIKEFSLLEMAELKVLSDGEIGDRFSGLSQEVDRLSRLDWNPNPKHWTKQIVQVFSSNDRAFRKQILQDQIWCLLREFIFCSPFRVFGDEGRLLETQWNERCGRDEKYGNGDYYWPNPGMETERWRYATIAECRASLKAPVPSDHDNRSKVRKGFISSLDRLREELRSTLGELVSLDKESSQILDKMTKKAANVWLEFAMQRCRILIVIPGSRLESAREKVQKAQGGTLELVVAPCLRRFGNSKGLDLAIEETVAGCKGETVLVGDPPESE